MHSYIYKISALFVLIIFSASCTGNSSKPESPKELVDEEVVDQEKILLDELAKLYPHGEDQFGETRKIIENNRLNFNKQPLLSAKKESLSKLKQVIKKLEEEIESYKKFLQDGMGPWQYHPRKEIEKGLKYDEKLLELYKLREAYYEREIKAAESKS
ncbi:MAG: hypothetical protein BGO68_06075 [Candidatus Amoebophilus sp. 36-38]|nr:MAG: hypothetical protein BGO68_06075 [Candidatus Amoebophilus sp. 36-38]